MDDPATVGANWASYFDDENQCNYYYNSVTQESAWSRPACMGFGNTGAVTDKTLEKEKSSSLLASAFGLDENSTENEDNSTRIKNPSPPKMPSPQKKIQQEIDNSFDSNDEFFAQLETEVGSTTEEDLAEKTKVEEEAKAKRQSELEQIVADEKKATDDKLAEKTKADVAAKAVKQAELEQIVALEKKTAADLVAKTNKEAKEAAEKAAKAKRQAELEAEKKITDDNLKRKAAEEEAEFLVKKEAKLKKQAELESFMKVKQAETEAKKRIDEEAEVVKVKAKEEIASQRKAELIRMSSDVVEKNETDEIPEEDTIDYSISMSKENDIDDKVAEEIDDEPMVKVIKEPKDKVMACSVVEDTVECNAAATKLQSIQRGRVAKKNVTNMKKESKKKNYDAFMAKQESDEHDVIATTVKQNVQSNNQKDIAAVKLQSLQRKRASAKQVAEMKKSKNAAAVTLQSLQRKRTAKQQVDTMKKEQKETNAKQSPIQINQKEPLNTLEITEITTEAPKKTTEPPKPMEKNKQYIGYKEGAPPKSKPILTKKGPRNHPRKAIAEAAKYLATNDEPIVPETKSDELKLPTLVTTDSKIEPTNRRKNRGNDLKHVNKRTVESMEKLETVAKETAPLESKSAPPNGRLPKIGAVRESSTERRKKKEPLFMRLEAQGRARSLALEKEKIENYQKIKASKKDAKPSKEAIMEHMHKYVEQRKAHINKEKEFAHAKQKEWTEQAKRQKLQNKSPPRKKIFEDPEKVPITDDFLPKVETQHNNKKKVRASKMKTPSKDVPHKVKKKLVKIKKLDFVDEEKERKAIEEQAKIDRHAKGKMYGKIAPSKHANKSSPARKKLNLIDDIHIPESPPGGPIAMSIIPSPRSPRIVKRKLSKFPSEDIDTGEVRDVIKSPRKSFHNIDHNGDNMLSPVLSIPKSHQHHKKRSPIVSRLSSLEDSNSSVPNFNAPYDGMIGSEWVSHVMEMDQEEATLADVYESGFEMFMIEKGILSDEL